MAAPEPPDPAWDGKVTAVQRSRALRLVPILEQLDQPLALGPARTGVRSWLAHAEQQDPPPPELPLLLRAAELLADMTPDALQW